MLITATHPLLLLLLHTTTTITPTTILSSYSHPAISTNYFLPLGGHQCTRCHQPYGNWPGDQVLFKVVLVKNQHFYICANTSITGLLILKLIKTVFV